MILLVNQMPQTKEEKALTKHTHYLNHKEMYKKWAENQHKNYPNYWKEYLRELKHWAVDKLGRKCSKCGLISEYDCVYDLHHLEENSWSKGFQRSSSNRRVKELIKWQKADKIPDDVKLLCSNCHRIEHN